MEWLRGDTLGFGSFSTVNLAITKTFSSYYPPLMAVKSCDVFDSALLKNEKQVLQQLGDCNHIIKCFGDDQTLENSQRYYNIFLEYASGGSLANHVKNSSNKFLESEARAFTRSVLKGLRYIHEKGFVHCDIKLQNLLLSNNGEVKIADFGLAKKAGTKLDRIEVRGTPLYMSPESVNENEYETPCDIWALGCVLLEMISGLPPWNCKFGMNLAALLIKIGASDEVPVIPDNVSDEIKDFLSKCFVKDPEKRWTAEMLLNHPLMMLKNDYDDVKDEIVVLKESRVEESTMSPRGPFDSHDWASVASSTRSELWFDNREEKSRHRDDVGDCWSGFSRPDERIKKLVSDQCWSWSDSEDWFTVR